MPNSNDNPISPTQRLRNAPRCQATAKGTAKRCKCTAVRGWRVCQVHGDGGGHRPGPSHPRWVHGGRSRDVTEARLLANLLARGLNSPFVIGGQIA